MKLRYVFSCMAFFVSVFCFNLTNKAYANVADDLNANYNKIVNDCGTPRRPAFLCSGVMIRLTGTSHKYHTWDPSPGSVARGGVSFTFLRRDIKVYINHNGSTSGIIYYPSMLKPSWKGRAEVLCSFPIDGWTTARPDSCGMNTAYPNGSQRCQAQGIYSANDWYKHFTSIPDIGNQRGYHQCGFDMSIGKQNTASIFNENIKEIQKIQSLRQYYEYNEIIIKTWPTVDGKIPNPELLPIEAFFYLDNGLADAQYFQQDYYNVTKIWIPIVKMVQNPDGSNTVFTYNASDQSVAGCSK